MARPRSFDEDAALNAAMRLFWRRGFDNTSISDLVEATGVNRYSLYATWGDKRGLFLAALGLYGTVAAAGPLDHLSRGGVHGIHEYFEGLATWISEDPSKLGCFTVNSIVDKGGDDEAARDRVRRNMALVRSAFATALQQEVDTGQLPADTDVDAHADHLTLSIQTVLLQARSGASRRAVDNFVRLTLSTLPEAP